jgi:hypothetical protein
MRILRLSLVCASLILLTLTSLGQLTVDATGPIRQRNREAASGHGGSSGRKLPLQVAIQTTGFPPDENGKTLVQFILTNSGKIDLILPISPHPGDLEPPDPKAPYTLLTLCLRISFSKKPGVILQGGADLYGSTSFPETLVSLAPGDSIRALTRIALPEARDAGPDAAISFIASASLNDETIRIVNGEILSDIRNLGFASSQEYTSDSLLRRHD